MAGMNNYLKTLGMVVAISAFLMLLIGVYTSAYLGLGSKATVASDRVTNARIYSSRSLAIFFTPAAQTERWLTGRRVFAGCPSQQQQVSR